MQEREKIASDPNVEPPEEKLCTCDVCQVPFNPKANAKTKKEGQIHICYITCPYCKARFEAYRTNTAIRDLQKRIRSERKRVADKIAKGTSPDVAQEKLKTMIQRLKDQMYTLNQFDKPV